MSVTISVSIGELWDKYSILLIKKDKIIDCNKLIHVNKEIEELNNEMNRFSYKDNELFLELKLVNNTLWDIEDNIRIKESKKIFDNEFIELSRNVYYTNDKRSELKKQINILFNSIIHEVKEYIDYK